MSPVAPPRTAERTFADAVGALDAALVRLHGAGIIIGHGIWQGDSAQTLGRRLQLRRGGQTVHLLIATVAPTDGIPPHAPPCRPATGDTVLRLFDPGCTAACPAACDSPAAFVALRLAPRIAAAGGEAPGRIARIIRHAPPLIDVRPSAPASLVETLFN